ncbi:MAG: penicillin-binding protein 2 [Oscillospiraceae bacterium]|nr:penicillin-binding protein 2 [Oscillospiraceae bacterium]
MSRTNIKLLVIAAAAGLAGIWLMWRIMVIDINRDYYLSFDSSAPRKVDIVCSYGEIYDRNGIPLVNRQERYIAVINPETADKNTLRGHIEDRQKYEECIDGTALFLCEVDSPELDSVTVINVKERYPKENSEAPIAPHIIGYVGEDGGVSGIEKSCNDILRQPKSTVTLSYSVDADGNMLEGDGLSMNWQSSYRTGVCTSLDYEIQLAAQNAMKNVEKGAVVVMDITTGDICAVVSCPDFDPAHPERSLDSEDSPFVNRAFSAYSVGSAFKLVTAGAALEYGISERYSYDCGGSIKVRGSNFDCHRYGGHGRLDMREAMVESCNPYFISLASDIPTDFLYEFAEGLGFGKACRLGSGIQSAAGVLPTARELKVPEEKANFAFGQGKVSATPLQITLLTAAIANHGQMPAPILINGDLSGSEVTAAAAPSFHRVMRSSTADKLRSYMISTLYKENSKAVPEFTTGGGKTSTAQTWTYNENGEENMNCWFTGFFPADEPRYAVTIMIEEGVSGNITCGPVFKEIADSVKMRRYSEKEK